ncbi:MAG TPA: heterodisulfide reductase, subunit B [Thermoplasmatales archaeon]|nr:heterodisulfide reductase, subunit B [Thermoplasmatales archaeon]
MEVAYYPGCTLKTNAKDFEETAIKVFELIGIEFKELDKWYCCGTVYSLATDNLMYRLAGIRNLIRAKEEGYEKLLTLCSICYNTLKQANLMAKSDKEAMEKINAFMDEEPDYDGSVDVIHPLQLIDKKFYEIKERVKKPLNKKYAAYYGCLLLRPKEVAIDEYENPSIMERLIEAMGGEAINFPLKNECCGSYNVAVNREAVIERTYRIVLNAKKNGADGIITSCPLCHFNLQEMQKEVKKIHSDFSGLPVYYFTEIMAEAFGVKNEGR